MLLRKLWVKHCLQWLCHATVYSAIWVRNSRNGSTIIWVLYRDADAAKVA